MAEHGHLARVAPAVPLEDLHRRCLARAVRAEQAEDLTLCDVEINSAQRLVRAVRLPQVADEDRGHSSRKWTPAGDRKSTRLNSSHVKISYAVFCLKKKKQYYVVVLLFQSILNLVV